MVPKPSRQLVIDADVASASGGEHAVHPTARTCRAFLEAVLQYNHHLVMTEEISDEWFEHQSRFARKWRVRMYGRRRVDRITLDPNADLTRKLDRLVCTENQREVIVKDLHLIEAARATDRTVTSCDEKVRQHFRNASPTITELKSIVWVNPDKPEERVIQWLADGAPPEAKRMLGWGQE